MIEANSCTPAENEPNTTSVRLFGLMIFIRLLKIKACLSCIKITGLEYPLLRHYQESATPPFTQAHFTPNKRRWLIIKPETDPAITMRKKGVMRPIYSPSYLLVLAA